MHLEVGGVPCFQTARECRELAEEAGLAVPSWAELSLPPPFAEEEPEPNQPWHSWQQKATRQLETKFVSDVMWPEGVVEVPVRTFGIGCSYRPPCLQGRALIISRFRSSFAADSKASARVASNVDFFDAFDGRRLEIVADGLTLLRGAHLATDTTVVSLSPLWRDGQAEFS